MKSRFNTSEIELGLGTVQFGIDYGISNKDGQCSLDEVKLILEKAEQEGIRIIDTAFHYGESENILGQILPKNHRFDLITKTPNFETTIVTSKEVKFLENTFLQSLKRLNQISIYGILIHHVDDLFKNGGDLLIKKLNDFKKQGLVKNIGVSVYTVEQINKILSNYSIDLIQVPINILDQRLLKSNTLEKIKSLGIEIHARSIFLQGLLLIDPEDLSPYFESIREHLKKYRLTLKKHKIKPVQAALNFIGNIQEIDVMLCGVSSHAELEDIISSLRKSTPLDFTPYAIDDSLILNPSNWDDRIY